MKISTELPPIWQSLIDNGMNPSEHITVVTYGDTIYNPGQIRIPPHLEKHEETHSKQQGKNPDAWWSRYIADPYFRIDQEAEAYARQYDFICKGAKDRNYRTRLMPELARTLSGPLYGNIIDTNAAVKLIKDKSKTK